MFSGATKASEPFFSQSQPALRHAVGDQPGADQRRLHHVLPGDPLRHGAGHRARPTTWPRCSTARRSTSLDDKSDYGTGLSTAPSTPSSPRTASRRPRTASHRLRTTRPRPSKIIAAAPDVLYYAGYYPDFGLLSKALHGAGFKGTLMSGDGSLDPAYITAAGTDAAEGTYFSCGCGDSNADPAQASFVAAVGEGQRGCTRPGTYSGEAYDATNSIISILKTLGSNPTRAALACRLQERGLQGPDQDREVPDQRRDRQTRRSTSTRPTPPARSTSWDRRRTLIK